MSNKQEVKESTVQCTINGEALEIPASMLIQLEEQAHREHTTIDAILSDLLHAYVSEEVSVVVH